jgi:hypothetical protein
VDSQLAAVLAVDAATAALAAYNAASLLFVSTESRRRRAAARTLAALNAGIAVQAVAGYALQTAHAFGADSAALLSPGAWLAARLPLLVGTAALALAIARRR